MWRQRVGLVFDKQAFLKTIEQQLERSVGIEKFSVDLPFPASFSQPVEIGHRVSFYVVIVFKDNAGEISHAGSGRVEDIAHRLVEDSSLERPTHKLILKLNDLYLHDYSNPFVPRSN